MTTNPRVIQVAASNTVNAVAFTRDGNHIFTGESDNCIRRRRIEDGVEQGTVMRANGWVSIVEVSPDGRWIATGDRGFNATIWNADTHDRVRQMVHPGNWLLAMDFSPDSTRIVTASGDNQSLVRVFEIASGNALLPELQQGNGPRGVKFSPDGTRFATVTLNAGSVRIYNIRNGEVLFTIPLQVRSWPVTPLAWSRDGQQLFIGLPGNITCFELATSTRTEWTTHNTNTHVSIVSNGRFIVCSAGSSISFWDLTTRRQIGNVIDHSAQINHLALSPNERHLACCHGNRVSLHNVRDLLPGNYFNDFLPLMRVSSDALAPWTQANLANTETILTGEISSASTPSFHTHANRSLVRARLNQPVPAIQDATRSIAIQSSPIGHIAMAVALLRQNDRDGAELRFNLAFHDCEPSDNRLLLLLQAVLMFECGKQDVAIERVDYLLTRVSGSDAFPHNQVLGAMRMRRAEYGPAITAFDRARQIAPWDRRSPVLTAISLIFGWTFNELDSVTAQQRLYELAFTAGRTSEAAQILLTIIQSSANRPTTDWLVGFHRRPVAPPPGNTVVDFPE